LFLGKSSRTVSTRLIAIIEPTGANLSIKAIIAGQTKEYYRNIKMFLIKFFVRVPYSQAFEA
jgi:hypothetical protein